MSPSCCCFNRGFPNNHAATGTSRVEQAPRSIEFNCLYARIKIYLVMCHNRHFLPRCCIPEPQLAVSPAGGKCLAIRRKGQSKDCARMSRKKCYIFYTLRIHNANQIVSATMRTGGFRDTGRRPATRQGAFATINSGTSDPL